MPDTTGMRLPQSYSRRISITTFFILVVNFLTFAALTNAGATTNQLQLSTTSLKFGNVEVGNSETQLVTLTNTGQTSITVSAITATGSEFSQSGLKLPATVAAGQTVSVNVKFAPSKTGWAGATVTFTNTSSNPSLRLSVGGNGESTQGITASPASLSFGQVAVGSSTKVSVVVNNPLTWKVTLSSLQTSGSGFSASGPSFPVVLNPGQSVSLSVTFAPKASGITGGSVFISGPQVNIPLTGTGTSAGQLGVSPATLSFGSVDVGNSATQPATLTATGGSVTVTSGSSSSAQYSVPGVSFPLTINSGQSVNVNVVFAPTQTGKATGTMTFNVGSASKSTESLTGTGITAQYTVNLSWNASTSSVSGYNVYRGTKVGTYTKINSSLDPATTYSDSTVSSGITYYYAATAVNSTGEESSYSSPVQVAVP